VPEHHHRGRVADEYELGAALAEYVAEVRAGTFPEERHTYAIPDDELAQFEAALTASTRPG
jgi:ketopantoate hydroxymethyltransferase